MTSAIEPSCDTVRCEIAPAQGGVLHLRDDVLQPGESLLAEMSIEVERVA